MAFNKEQKKKWYKENREKILQQHKIYYVKNKKEINRKHKIYRESHKEELKKYRESHKEQIKKYPSSSKEYYRNYRKNKRKRNITYRLLDCLRSRIYDGLKRKNKSISTMKLIGCTIEKLKEHLQKQFQPGMTWFNYGRKGWVIDHIIPCASFDLSKLRQQKKCFHYTNLQPLWVLDNLIKKDKIIN